MRAVLVLHSKKLDHQSTILPNGIQADISLCLDCKRNKKVVSITENHFNDFQCSGNVKKTPNPFLFLLSRLCIHTKRQKKEEIFCLPFNIWITVIDPGKSAIAGLSQLAHWFLYLDNLASANYRWDSTLGKDKTPLFLGEKTHEHDLSKYLQACKTF